MHAEEQGQEGVPKSGDNKEDRAAAPFEDRAGSPSKKLNDTSTRSARKSAFLTGPSSCKRNAVELEGEDTFVRQTDARRAAVVGERNDERFQEQSARTRGRGRPSPKRGHSLSEFSRGLACAMEEDELRVCMLVLKVIERNDVYTHLLI